MPGTEERERLAELGMTEAEIELWLALAGIGERHELVHGMHRVQDQLLARPGRRAVSGASG